jgi:hypothetical protein
MLVSARSPWPPADLPAGLSRETEAALNDSLAESTREPQWLPPHRGRCRGPVFTFGTPTATLVHDLVRPDSAPGIEKRLQDRVVRQDGIRGDQRRRRDA